MIGPIYFSPNLVSSILIQIEIVASIKLNNDTFIGDILQISGDNNLTGNDTIYIMKDKGIIGWKKNNDTYNVTQYLIQ